MSSALSFNASQDHRAPELCDAQRVALLARRVVRGRPVRSGGSVDELLWSKRITSAIRTRTAVLGVAALDCSYPCTSSSSHLLCSCLASALVPLKTHPLLVPLPFPFRQLSSLLPPSLPTLRNRSTFLASSRPHHTQTISPHLHLVSPQIIGILPTLQE